MLYDVKEKRGWLSDGLPVLLHLVRTSLRRDEKEDPYHLFTQHIEKLNESPSSVQGTTAAKAVLFDGENRLFNLHLIDTKVTEQIIERTINGDTIKEIVRIKEATHYRFENRVEEICLLLEKTIDQTAKAIKEGVLRDTPKNLLGGFDFVGVATRSQLRHITTKIPIPTHAYGWTDLVDSLEVVTLFGSDFGELIKPRVDNPSKSCNRCGYGASLPSGKNHVAVCVDVLERIIETNGNKDTTGWRLTDDLYWHFNEPAFRSCCTSLNGQRVNPKTGNWIQILSSKNIYHHPELLIPKNGMGNDAVIFGHSRPRLVRMSRNIGIKRDLLPDESILSQTSFEVSISSRPPDENSGANENQLFETVSSATPITGSSRTDRSGSESYHDLSETMSSNTPNTSNSSGRGELGSNGTTVDQQCFSSEVSERPEIIDTLPQNAPKKLPTDSPEKSFGRIKNTCARAWNKLKRHKESPDSKMRGVNQIEI
ncbi:hypothetical protein TrVGV298_010565 [Trichoderma virens]|nr:hypothetical protein TrVGV298_010565 [Trichoderma virens]